MKKIHPKVKAGALAGAVVTAAVSICAACGITVPDSAAALLTVLATAVSGYAAKDPNADV